jgi:hypothetical protein
MIVAVFAFTPPLSICWEPGNVSRRSYLSIYWSGASPLSLALSLDPISLSLSGLCVSAWLCVWLAPPGVAPGRRGRRGRPAVRTITLSLASCSAQPAVT